MNVFITGASSGIGMALAQAFAARGARLGLLARRRELLEELRASLPQATQHCLYAVDVCDHAALAAAAADFQQQCGRVDVVIANAGISHGSLTEDAADLPVFRQIMDTNYLATVATFSPFIQNMRHQGGLARLVAISSVAGIRGLPGAAAYCASKAAVTNYCEALRLELRSSGIQVVTLAPGFIATPLTAKNHFKMPFLMPANRFAEQAVSVILRGERYRILPWQMALVGKLLYLLPNGLYDRIMTRTPRKGRD